MAIELVFEKKLTHTDINHMCLSFPPDKLGILPGADAHARDPVQFLVNCGEEVYKFCCTKRHEGYLKPVIQRGWSKLVRDNHLQIGDSLEFYMEASDGGPTNYYIKVHRCVSRYDDGYGTAYDWQRIV